MKLLENNVCRHHSKGFCRQGQVANFCIQNLTANSTCKKDTVLKEPAKIDTDIPADSTKAELAAKKKLVPTCTEKTKQLKMKVNM